MLSLTGTPRDEQNRGQTYSVLHLSQRIPYFTWASFTTNPLTQDCKKVANLARESRCPALRAEVVNNHPRNSRSHQQRLVGAIRGSHPQVFFTPFSQRAHPPANEKLRKQRYSAQLVLCSQLLLWTALFWSKRSPTGDSNAHSPQESTHWSSKWRRAWKTAY